MKQFTKLSRTGQARSFKTRKDSLVAIDLVDGNRPVKKLNELALGVTTTIVGLEHVGVDADWGLSFWRAALHGKRFGQWPRFITAS